MENLKLSCFASDVNPRKMEILRRYLLPGRVLDIGCGNGLYGLEIVAQGGSVLQLDVAERRDPRARHLPFIEMDAHRLDMIDGCFDDILAFDIMEHLDDDGFFLTQIRRICRGRLFLSVPNADDEQPRRISLTHIHHTDKTHRRTYTSEMLCQLLEYHGFDAILIQPQLNEALPYFANVLAKESTLAKASARLISLQCLLLDRLGLFENRCIADWLCVAE